jgi:hypothetical protein
LGSFASFGKLKREMLSSLHEEIVCPTQHIFNSP